MNKDIIIKYIPNTTTEEPLVAGEMVNEENVDFVMPQMEITREEEVSKEQTQEQEQPVYQYSCNCDEPTEKPEKKTRKASFLLQLQLCNKKHLLSWVLQLKRQ